MKKYLKVIAMVLIIAMIGVVAVACSGNKDNDKEKEKPVLVMGTNAEFEPFEYKSGGNVVGIDVDIMQAIADDLGMTLKIEDMEFDSLPAALSAANIDCIAAGFTANPEREESMDFTDGYYNASQTIIVLEGSDIKTADDLKDKDIGVQSGTTGHDLALEYTDEARVVPFDAASTAIVDLKNGNLDAIIIDNNPAKKYAEQNDGLALLEGLFESEVYVIATGKNNELCDKINASLKKLMDDGTIDAIIAKYIKD